MRFSLCLFLLALPGMMGCTVPSAPESTPRHRIAVRFTLTAGDTLSAGAIAHVIPDPPKKGYHGVFSLVPDAGVYLNGIHCKPYIANEAQRIRPDHISPDRWTPPAPLWAYRCTSPVISPQKSYQLEVYAHGDTAVGTTTVPSAFDIHQLDTDKGIVRWIPSEGAAYYYVTVKRPEYDAYKAAWEYYAIESTSLYETEYAFRKDELRNDLGRFRVEVIALDRNIFAYRELAIDPAGLEGAYGYFGSCVRVEKEFPVDW